MSNNIYNEKVNENNINRYINCYKNTIGYYLDKNIYKKRYYTCKECKLTGNNTIHNCLTCKDNYYVSISNNGNYSNCCIDKIIESTIIPFSTITTSEIKIKTINEVIINTSMTKESGINSINLFTTITNTTTTMPKKNNVTNTYIYTFNLSSPEEYTELLIDTKEYIKTKEIKNLMEDIIEKENNETKTEEEIIKYYNTILKIIEIEFTSDNYDTKNLDSGKDEVIKMEKMNITLTTTDNQKNNNNFSSVDSAECELLLRNYYNLTNSESLYMKKVDILQESMRIPKIEYDIYCKLYQSKLIKLNLTICQNSKVSIIIPIKVNDNIDILNSSSGYYNDIIIQQHQIMEQIYH